MLADRLVDAMKRAWDGTARKPIDSSLVEWRSIDVILPAASHLNEKELLGVLRDPGADDAARLSAAKGLAWLLRTQRAEKTEITCLRLGDAMVFQMPGELFVEYQLAAQKMRPDRFIAMAAYGDYGPGYIGTRVAYSQGGYETSPGSSLVAPASKSPHGCSDGRARSAVWKPLEKRAKSRNCLWNFRLIDRGSESQLIRAAQGITSEYRENQCRGMLLVVKDRLLRLDHSG